jgi:hypothetical protein
MCWFYMACGGNPAVVQPACGTSGVPVSCDDGVANCENFVGFFREHTPLSTCPPQGSTALAINEDYVHAYIHPNASASTTVVATFEVPRAGCVRLGTRVWAPSFALVGPRSDANYEVVRIGATGAQSIRCAEVTAGDEDGIVMLDRLWVDQGDRLQFRVRRFDPTLGADVFFDPSIVYEGRRLTYRVVRAGLPAQHTGSPNPNERFLTRIVGNWSSWQALAMHAGSDWSQFWSTPPMPPLEIELAAAPMARGPVAFDDVHAFVHYCDATPDQLADEIESYLGWSRQISAMQRDRGHDAFEAPAQPNPDPLDENRVGPSSTPYQIWRLRAKAGKSFGLAANSIGAEPDGLWGRLAVDFDATDYADACWLREQEWFHRDPNTERLYTEYDCTADLLTGSLPNNACQASSLGEWKGYFERTRDVTQLKTAAIYAQAAAEFGVNANGQSCDTGLIEFAPLPACGTPPAPFVTSPKFLDSLHPTGELVRIYCAAKRWKLEHPTSSYLDDADLDLWMQVAHASLDPVERRMRDHFAHLPPTAVQCANSGPCDATTWSSITWHRLPGALDDDFGYLAADAAAGRELDELIAFEQQLGSAPTPFELDVAARLDCIVDSGVANILPAWFECTVRSDPNAADQVRGWPYFLPRAAVASACDGTVTAGSQLVLAARYWTKFQFRGTWLNTWQMPQQLCDLGGAAGQAGLAPHYYVEGMLLAARAASPQDAKDLRDQLYTILRTTRLAYRDAWGLQYGFAMRPFGWPAYAPDLDAMSSGFQRRSIDAMVEGLTNAGWEATGVHRAPAPQVYVDPPSLSAQPASPVFSFCLRLPGQLDPAALQTALDQRTEIGWWHATTNGWEYEVLWPTHPNWTSFSAPTPCTAPDSIGLVLAVAPGYPNPFAHQTFKLEIHAWDADGQWDRDTSYQEW